MNKILNNKININLVNIIRSYNLPLLNNHHYYFDELIDKTYNIQNSLNIGKCYSMSGYDYNVFDLKKSKIKIICMRNYVWWTIRKL